MLVISSSVRILNGIQRTTSDLRPATSFHLVLVKIGTSLQDWPVRCDSDSECSVVRSCPSGTVVLFKVKLVLAEPAGTCSGTAVPASRIPTRCVGMGCFCDDSGALMLSMKLSLQPSSSVSYLSACWAATSDLGAVLSAKLNASCAAFYTACVSWMIRSNSEWIIPSIPVHSS